MDSEKKNTNEKWVSDTALLFFRIFSADYQDPAFVKKLMAGGGGNSTLCSTWTHLSRTFVTYRISRKAYNLLLEKIEDEDKDKIRLERGTVFISRSIERKYSGLFFNNAKGAEKRAQAGKFFHYDHNPSNKKVLDLLKKKVKGILGTENSTEELAKYIKSVQTIDLITIYEDDTRTSKDRESKSGPLSANARDRLLKTKFYPLVFQQSVRKKAHQ